MPSLLFKLRNVPDDEAEDVRELLSEHNIEFYETTAGNWGISMPGIWLHNDNDYPTARQLLDTYQQQRSQQHRAEYQAAKAEGRAETQWQWLRQEPLKVIGSLLAILILLYLSISIFY